MYLINMKSVEKYATNRGFKNTYVLPLVDNFVDKSVFIAISGS